MSFFNQLRSSATNSLVRALNPDVSESILRGAEQLRRENPLLTIAQSIRQTRETRRHNRNIGLINETEVPPAYVPPPSYDPPSYFEAVIRGHATQPSPPRDSKN